MASTLTPTRGDLITCESEQIHIPGAIQPYGVLMSLAEPDLKVEQISDSAQAFLGRPPAELLGTPVSLLIAQSSMEELRRAIGDPDWQYLNPLQIEASGKHFDGIVHRSEGALILELEPASGVEGPANNKHVLRRALVALQSARTLADLCGRIAQEVRRLTGFERVLIYEFNRAGDGYVNAESKDDLLESYLGLHYPASDIPIQARALYLKNWLRIIPDAGYAASRIVPPLRPLSGEALDLSFAVLRSVSPVHLEYMANMGVRAAMSISLVIDGQLWGLISCANHSRPRFVPFEVRSACEVLAKVTSRQIAALIDHEALAQRTSRRGIRTLLSQSLRSGDVLEGLLQNTQALLALVNAEGAAIIRGKESQACGSVPPPAVINELVDWLDERGATAPYATCALAGEFERSAAVSAVASGILTFSLPGLPRRRVIWFRPELLKNVTWGGDPTKSATTDPLARLSPRKSFEAWLQQVRLTSIDWTTSDLEAAEELRRDALEIDLERQVLREQRAVRARDDLVAVVSHDLRNPLGVIQMQAAILLKSISGADEEISRRIQTSAGHIQRAVAKMNTLILDLLDLAKLEAGRFTVHCEPQRISELVEESLTILRPLAEAKQIELTSRVDDAEVSVDRDRIFQVFSNLIGNAIKFTSAAGRIDLDCTVLDSEVRLTVVDSGPGISAEQITNLFDRYWQARTNHLAGSGLGLFIAKGIVEAHGGKIWAEVRPNSGAVLCFTLPTIAASGEIKTVALAI